MAAVILVDWDEENIFEVFFLGFCLEFEAFLLLHFSYLSIILPSSLFTRKEKAKTAFDITYCSLTSSLSLPTSPKSR